MLKHRTFGQGDKVFFFLPLFLAIFGLLMIFNASSVSALHDFGNKWYYLEHQGVWLAVGMIAYFLGAFVDYRLIKKLALPLFLINLVLLLAVLLPGIGKTVYGGRRWLALGFFRFQPAELTKLSLVFYLATLWEKRREFLSFLVLTAVVLGLLLMEPDLGTAIIIIATAFSLYFIAGAPLSQVFGFLGLGFILTPILILTSAYRKERFLGFLRSSFSPTEASYHVRQILIALGGGGIFGRGLGESRQKFLFLPEVTTDSIFAVIAEEFGFLGAMALIGLFAFLVFRGLKLALSLEDPFARMLVVGIIFFLGFQALVNLGSMVTLIPLTGVPLPFISYGGSSLVVSLAGMGIVYNISRKAS